MFAASDAMGNNVKIVVPGHGRVPAKFDEVDIDIMVPPQLRPEFDRALAALKGKQ